MIAYVPEFEAADRFRGVARQHLTGRCHIEGAPAPAAGARLWIARVIIRDDRIDDDSAAAPPTNTAEMRMTLSCFSERQEITISQSWVEAGDANALRCRYLSRLTASCARSTA